VKSFPTENEPRTEVTDENPGPIGGGAATRVIRSLTTALPVKGWTLVTERLHPLLGHREREVLYRDRNGVLFRLDLDDYVQRGILYGAYEVTELAFTRRVLRAGQVMLDVGGHVGTFGLVAAQAVGPTGSVHAFEPLPFNFSRYEANRDLNRLTNLVLNRAAVGSEPGVVSLGLDQARHVTRDTPAWQAGYAVGLGGDAVEAPQLTLDDYTGEHLAGRTIRLVKIDVEGREPEVLAGMRRLLADHRVEIVLMEVNLYALERFGHRIADSVAPLEAAGYRPHSLGVGGRLRRWKYAGEPAPRPPRSGIVATISNAIADRVRNFNLVWLGPGIEIRR
jgi:FkbM family methyltransferase